MPFLNVVGPVGSYASGRAAQASCQRQWGGRSRWLCWMRIRQAVSSVASVDLGQLDTATGQWPGVGGALLRVGPLEHALLPLGRMALPPGAHQLAVEDELDHAVDAADLHDVAGQPAAGSVVAAGERDRPVRVDPAADHPRVAGQVIQRGQPGGLVQGKLAAVVGTVGLDASLLGRWVPAGPGAHQPAAVDEPDDAVEAGDLDHLAGEAAADPVVGTAEADGAVGVDLALHGA